MITYECLNIIMKVAGLRVSIEQMQCVPAVNDYLRVQHTLVRQCVADYTVGVRVELGLHNREP